MVIDSECSQGLKRGLAFNFGPTLSLRQKLTDSFVGEEWLGIPGHEFSGYESKISVFSGPDLKLGSLCPGFNDSNFI